MRWSIVVFVLVLTGCGWLGSAVRTVWDVARCLCEVTAAEQSEEKLGGMSADEWCDVRENLEPFVAEVTAAKQAASQKSGLTKEPAK